MRHLCALIDKYRLNQRDFAGEKRFRNEKFAVFSVSTSFLPPFSFPSRVIAGERCSNICGFSYAARAVPPYSVFDLGV